MKTDKKKWQVDFGLRLKQIMDEFNYSIHQLAKETGISKGALCNYIHGRYSPSITSLIAIAQSLNIDYIVLLEPSYGSPIERRYYYYDEDISESRWIEDFSFNLEAVLKRENCTQSELSYGTGISQGLISKYISGSTLPSGYSIMAIAKYLAYDDNYDELIDLGLVQINR